MAHNKLEPVKFPHKPTMRRLWLWVGLVTVVTLLIYLPAIGFGFFQEDGSELPSYPFDSLSDLLLEPLVGGLYYRPLARLIMTMLRCPNGVFLPRPYHLYQLALHALNAGLVFLLAERVWRPADSDRALWAGLASAGLWAVYPWAYDSVVRITTFQPLATFLVLTSVVTYLRYRDTSQLGWLIVASLASVLAPAEHELGLVAGALVFASEVWAWLIARDRFRWEAVVLLGLGAGYGVWWLTRTPSEPGNIERLDDRWLYFAQAIAYPGVALAYFMLPSEPLPALAIGLVLSLPVLIIALRVNWQAVIYSIAWFALLVAPAAIGLSYFYITRAPRILYPPGIGVAMMWGGVALFAVQGRWWRRVLSVVPVGVFLFSLVLVVRNHRMYAAASAATDALIRLGTSRSVGERLVILDFPETYAHRCFAFPYGWEGMGVATSASRLEEFIALPGGPPIEMRDYTALPYTHAADDFSYIVTTRGPIINLETLLDSATWADETYYTVYLPSGGVVYRPSGAIETIPTEAEALAYFGEGLVLLNARAEALPDGLQVETVWKVEPGLEPLNPNVTLFVHLRTEGEIVAQADGDLLAGLLPPAFVPVGIVVRDVRHITLSAPEAVDTVAVGAYNWASSDRLQAVDAQGRPIPENTYTLSVHLDIPPDE